MRAIVRAVPIALALLVASGSGPAAAAKHTSPSDCAVPRGWRLVGRDNRSVVIGKFVATPAALDQGKVLWDFCLRPRGRFRRLTTVTEGPYSYSVGGVKLAGLYFGYWAAQGYHGANVYATLYLWRLAPRHVANATYDDTSGDCYEPFGSPGDPNRLPPGFPGVPAGYLLTATGIAAWRADRCAYTKPVEDIEALDSNTGQRATLDSASTHGVLANLQLYRCATGCLPGTTVVAWTHDKVRRHRKIR